MSRFFGILLGLFLLLWTTSAVAHGKLDEQIAAVTARITLDSTNAKLYLKRGQLYTEHEEFLPAKRDYEKARTLSPNLIIVDLQLAELYAQQKEFNTALYYAHQFLKQSPNHPNGLIERAGIYQEMGFPDSCQMDLEQALIHIPEPNPGHYLSITEAVLLADTTNVTEALLWLKKGQKAFGFDIVLQSKEIDLLIWSEQYDQALESIDALLEVLPRKEKWLFKKATIYEITKELHLAKMHYHATLMVINKLPKRLQGTQRILDLQLKAMERLKVIN